MFSWPIQWTDSFDFFVYWHCDNGWWSQRCIYSIWSTFRWHVPRTGRREPESIWDEKFHGLIWRFFWWVFHFYFGFSRNFYFSAYLLCSLDLNSFALSEILGGADRLLFLILFFGFSLAIYISLGEVHRSNHSVNIFHFAQIQPNPTREIKKKMRFYFSQMREFKIGATYLLFIYHSISSNCHHFYSRFQQ